MPGEINLDHLIRNTKPKLHSGTYVFCCINEPDTNLLMKAIAHFKEEEGVTLVISKEHADLHHLPYTFEAAWIELNIHSDLEAVGLTAAVSKALTDEGISCNVIAGYYHDHLFVPKELANSALKALISLSEGQ